MHVKYLSLAYKFGKMSMQMETSEEEERMEAVNGGLTTYLPARSHQGCKVPLEAWQRLETWKGSRCQESVFSFCHHKN